MAKKKVTKSKTHTKTSNKGGKGSKTDNNPIKNNLVKLEDSKDQKIKKIEKEPLEDLELEGPDVPLNADEEDEEADFDPALADEWEQ